MKITTIAMLGAAFCAAISQSFPKVFPEEVILSLDNTLAFGLIAGALFLFKLGGFISKSLLLVAGAAIFAVSAGFASPGDLLQMAGDTIRSFA